MFVSVYGIYGGHAGSKLGVVADNIPKEMSMQMAADRHFIEPLITLPRQVPVGCEFLFGLADPPQPLRINPNEAKRLAGQLLLAGWEYGRVHEDGGSPTRDKALVSEVTVPGFRKYMAEAPELLDPCLDLFLEGQHGYLSRRDPNPTPVRRQEEIRELVLA